jgi:chemotaxis protein MotB
MGTRVTYAAVAVTACVLALTGCSNKQELQARDAEIASLRQQLGQLDTDYAAATARAQRLEAELNEIAAREQATLDKLEGMTILRLPETALFASASATLSGDGLRLMERIGGTLASYPTYEIRVEGHTDNVPLRGGENMTNWELSTLRATTVVRHLIGQHQMSPERLVAVGYGEHRPLYSNDTVDGRKRNRRVEFHIATPQPVRELPSGVASAD